MLRLIKRLFGRQESPAMFWFSDSGGNRHARDPLKAWVRLPDFPEFDEQCMAILDDEEMEWDDAKQKLRAQIESTKAGVAAARGILDLPEAVATGRGRVSGFTDADAIQTLFDFLDYSYFVKKK